MNKKIAFIGAGNMCEGLIKGLLDASLFSQESICTTDIRKERLDLLKERYGIKTSSANREAVTNADIIILSVKPQIINRVLEQISDLCDHSKLMISIAAGTLLAELGRYLPEKKRVIRVMPNSPTMVKEGVTAICATADISEGDREIARHIFNSVGKTVFVDEKMMDAVTGLSGSGPAYAYLTIEAMADGGVKMGLPRNTAVLLAAQTLKGAAEMVLKTGQHTGELIDMVTSPGGTTIAGLHALEKGGFRAALMNAVESASIKSYELGKIKINKE